MMKDLSFDEIQQFFEDLNTHPFSKQHKAMIYGMAKAFDEIREKEKLIRDYFAERKYNAPEEIYLVGNEIQIAKYEADKYWIFLNYKFINYITESFDEALLMALCEKHGCPDAACFIAKMLSMNQGNI